MSGFTHDPKRYGEEIVFELTSTKAGYWHRNQLRCDHGRDPADIVKAHAIPAGFEIVHDGGAWVAVRGPGIAEEKTAALYAAISGREISEVSDR